MNDWEYPKSKKFFNSLKKYDYNINLSYAAGNGNLYEKKNLDYFAKNDLKNKKC